MNRRYKFGFVLTTAAGNMTRYLNLRKYAERATDIECVWAPISHYMDKNPYWMLPKPLQTRLIVMKQAEPVIKCLDTFHAVMFHAFEPYAFSVFRSVKKKYPRIVWSQDNPPVSLGSASPQAEYGGDHQRSGIRGEKRFELDMWCAKNTALFLPFSQWAGEVLVNDLGVPSERVCPIHVGMDLELWKFVPFNPLPQTDRLQILFVGGDFERKGGNLLLEVFRNRFQGSADLHLVTGRRPEKLPPNVYVYTDMVPNDKRLHELYGKCDVFVLPTKADMTPWVALEAMAVGRPLIISDLPGTRELVQEGETGFLIPVGDGQRLAERLTLLQKDRHLRLKMGMAGRKLIEEHYNSAICVPRILEKMRSVVDGTNP